MTDKQRVLAKYPFAYGKWNSLRPGYVIRTDRTFSHVLTDTHQNLRDAWAEAATNVMD